MNLRVESIPAVIALSLLLAGTANAGLLITDGAEPVAAKHVEVELNGSYASDSSSNGVTTRTGSTDGDITVTAGLTKGLDIAVTLPYTFNSRETVDGDRTPKSNGFNDMTIDLKYQFLEIDGLKLAIKPGIILPTGKTSEGLSDGNFGFTTALLATKEFAEGKFLLYANAGYEHHSYKDEAVKDATRADIYTFSMACEADIAEGVKLGADTGLATSSDRSSDTPPVYALVGLTYELSKLLDVYAGIKAGLTSPEADVTALFGLKLKF